MSRAAVRWLVSCCLEQVAPDAYPPEAVAKVIEEDPDDVREAMEDMVEQGRLERVGRGYCSHELDTRVA